MKLKHRMLGLLLVASVSAWGLAGCGGAECGEGTTDQDGTCVPEVTCGSGTKAEGGECVVGDDGCAAGTEYNPDTKTCVISGTDACADGTSYDPDSQTCVSDISGCGENTELKDGECVPTLEALCDGMGAVKVEDGKCVVAEAACTEGTMLSANGNCVVAQEACGSGLELNDQGQCVPTDQVCGDKTSFDSDMGLCLPDETCQMGDKVVDGVCVSPAEALARTEDAVQEMENNDPDTGGTPNEVTLKQMTGEPAVFTGTIEAPRTINGSDNKQDVDAFKFSADAGQWVKLSVQSMGLPAPLMVVTGPEGYQRISPIGRPALTETEMRKDDAGRKLVLPYQGDYTVTVLPTAQAVDGDVAPAGADNWKYVGAIEKVDAGMATPHDLSMNALTGTFGNPESNFYKVSGFTAGDLVEFSFDKEGEDIGGILQLWKDTSTLVSSIEINAGESAAVPLPQDIQNDEFFVLLDWDTMTGPDTGYEVSAKAIQNQENLGNIMADGEGKGTTRDLKDDEVYYYTFQAQAGEFLEIEHTNDEDEEIDYVLSDSSGTELQSQTFYDVPTDSFIDADEGYYYTKNGGSFTLKATATDDLTNHQLTIDSMTPGDAGMGGVGDTLTLTQARQGGTLENRSDFAVVTFNERVLMSATLTPTKPNGDEDVDFYLYDSDYNELIEKTGSGGAVSVDGKMLDAGTYLVRVEGDEAFDEFKLEFTLEKPPLVVDEPNNSKAQASPINFTDELAIELDSNDTDWMKFDIASDMPATESVWFNLAIDRSETDDFTCQLLDNAGNVIHEVKDRDWGCSLFGTGLKQGTYFVKVEYTDSSTFDFDDTRLWLRRIEAAAESEPNDTMMAPNTPMLTRNGNRLSVIGAVDASNTDDYFEFTLPGTIPSGAQLHIGLTMLGPEHGEKTEWELFDSMGNSVVKKSYDEVHTIANPTAGATYTLQVIGDSGDLGSADGEYVLRAEVYNPDQTVTGGTDIDFSGNAGQSSATDSVNVSNCATVDRVSVTVDIEADEKGEQWVALSGPGGDTVKFWPAYRFGDDQEDFMPGNWPIQKVSRNDFSVFNGTTGNGMWTLEVFNTGALSFETREIKSWSLNLNCQ